MGEIFKRERASQSLRFSGERLTDEATGQIEIEHLHRYFVARHYCRGKDVLDIAAGEGYGSAYLAQVARSVVGVEIDPNAVAHAAKSYCYPNLRFQTGDARYIDLPDASVDVVVSFETLEHFYEHEDFIREIRRVLRGDGLLIISTPEQDVYSPTFSPANPFHVRELTKTQFVGLLQRDFPWVELCFQRPMVGSVLVPEYAATKKEYGLFVEKRGPAFFEMTEGMARPLYLVAFASAVPHSVPNFSAYIEENAVDFWRIKARDATEIGDRVKLELSDAQARRLALEEKLASAHAGLEALYRSTSWRITAPARLFMSGIKKLTSARQRQHSAVVPGGALTQSNLDTVHNKIATKPQRDPQSAEALLAKQRKNLGEASQKPAVQIALGIVTFNNDVRDLGRLLSSAQVALECAKLEKALIYLIDNGATTDPALLEKYNIHKLESQGNIGFGAAHNLLMHQAFDSGAELYIATNPDGAFHPDAVNFMAAMNAAQAGNSLIEAIQFPEEHPKIYDISSFDTPWASGACLAIPRKIYQALGGFDESFFMYCEDVDYSWRARANGFAVKICPRALFFHSTTNRKFSETTQIMMLRSGVILAQKWGATDFEKNLVTELKKLSSKPVITSGEQVDSSWRSVTNFENLFHFSEVRWT